jgi:hypothetical protein
MSITSKMQGKKFQREISLAKRIEPGRMMKWYDGNIAFGLEDHLDREMSEGNLPFMVKIPIGRHNVVKTLIDSGASLNLMMRKTFIKMGLNFTELTLVHYTFHQIIPGQSSTPSGASTWRYLMEQGTTSVRRCLRLKWLALTSGRTASSGGLSS